MCQHETWLSMKRGNDNGEVYGDEGLPFVWDCNAYTNQLQPLIKEICDVYHGPNPPITFPLQLRMDAYIDDTIGNI